MRTICSDCAEPFEPDPAQLPVDFNYQSGEKLQRGAGCRKCRGTGYYGRTGLFELMMSSEAIRQNIMDRAPTGRVLTTAKAEGLRLLREDGWMKVRNGITTPEEVIRATKA